MAATCTVPDKGSEIPEFHLICNRAFVIRKSDDDDPKKSNLIDEIAARVKARHLH